MERSQMLDAMGQLKLYGMRTTQRRPSSASGGEYWTPIGGHEWMLIDTRSSLNESDLRSGRAPEGAEKTAVTFNGSFRNELLNETLLSTLAEAREQIGAWKEDYNRHRPHSSLGNLTPQEFEIKSRLETKAA